MSDEKKPSNPCVGADASKPAASTTTSCPNPPLNTGLGQDVDKAIEKCPKFGDKVKGLQAKGWTMQYGPAGKGSSADRQSKVITVDSNEKGNTAAVVETMSHESGHAAYTPDPYVQPSGLTEDQYAARNANSGLKDEGEATLSNIEMKDCLKANGGTDIGIAGTQGPAYQAVADKYPNAADRDKARQEIGDIFADKEHPSTDPTKTYRQYYEKSYRDFYKNLPPAQKTP